MKIISLWQPWASLVALGAKVHETRSWPTTYRGPLLIHAARRWDRKLQAEWVRCDTLLYNARELRLPFAERPRGCVVALVELADCGPIGSISPASSFDRIFGDWDDGRYAWRLTNPRRLLKPIPWLGQQGLRDAPAELVALVRQTLTA
jgi:activating signal cointegrator 1